MAPIQLNVSRPQVPFVPVRGSADIRTTHGTIAGSVLGTEPTRALFSRAVVDCSPPACLSADNVQVKTARLEQYASVVVA